MEPPKAGRDRNRDTLGRFHQHSTSSFYLHRFQKQKHKKYNQTVSLFGKALHSELLAELSVRFSSRNEYFRISELRIVRHFFEVFGKFGKMTFPKPRKYYENFCENYSNFLASENAKTFHFLPFLV